MQFWGLKNVTNRNNSEQMELKLINICTMQSFYVRKIRFIRILCK